MKGLLAIFLIACQSNDIQPQTEAAASREMSIPTSEVSPTVRIEQALAIGRLAEARAAEIDLENLSTEQKNVGTEHRLKVRLAHYDVEGAEKLLAHLPPSHPEYDFFDLRVAELRDHDARVESASHRLLHRGSDQGAAGLVRLALRKKAWDYASLIISKRNSPLLQPLKIELAILRQSWAEAKANIELLANPSDKAFWRGRLLLAQEKYEPALMNFAKADVADPLPRLSLEAEALLGLGRWRDSEDVLEQVLRINPNSGEARFVLAKIALNHRRDLARAAQYFSEAALMSKGTLGEQASHLAAECWVQLERESTVR